MNYRANKPELPKLIESTLEQNHQPVDNIFSDAWCTLKIGACATKAGIAKRSGCDAQIVVFMLLVWRWVGAASVSIFCKSYVESFCTAKKDVLYDFLKRNDLNWRRWNLLVAKKVFERHATGRCVFVVDDSIKARRSKSMDGVSSHWDHVENKYVTGHQVVTLGVNCDNGFIPLDSEISVSKSKRQQKDKTPSDQRSRAAKRYKQSRECSKIELVSAMVKRALRAGINATYLAADSWYGNKAMMTLAVDQGLTGILRMKNGKLKFRMDSGDGRTQDLNAAQIYQSVRKGKWEKVKVYNSKWQMVSVKVKVNLENSNSKTERWHEVKLLYVKGLNLDADKSKDRWALFLSTDADIDSVEMLEVYAMRWSIEVYFKESKQHLKWLGEQTRSFASHSASLHLSSVCYLVLVHLTLEGGYARVGETRDELVEQIRTLSYAQKLWKMFRVLIHNAVSGMGSAIGCSANDVMEAVDRQVEMFFVEALQLDSRIIQHEHCLDGPSSG